MDENKCIRLGDYTLRFEDDEDMGPVFVERAEQQLGETPAVRAQALHRLKELIANEPDLIAPLDNEILLLAFLRACKFCPESAFQRMQRYYKFKNKYHKYCADLVPDTERNVFEQAILTTLPSRDQHGRRLLLIEAGGKWHPRDCSLVELMRGVMLIVEAAICEPRTQVSGAVVIIDLIGLTLNHVIQYSPSFAKMILEYLQDCTPCSIKGIHIVNQPYVFNMLFAIFKPFIQEKLRNRIHFHGEDMSSLLNHIDSKAVLNRYGGDMELPFEEGVKLYHLLCQYSDEYLKTNTYGYPMKKTKNGKLKECT